MNLFILELLLNTPYNNIQIGIQQTVAGLPVFTAAQRKIYASEIGLYIGAVLLLFALIIFLLTIFERAKSNRIIKQEERFISDIFVKITHEIRTPLTVILGLSKQLREQENLTAKNLSIYLGAIERQGKSLSELVNQLLDIANLQTSEKALEWKTGNIVTFVEMIAETFRIYAGQKDLELNYYSNETEIETDFCPDFLHKILYNLLNNAIKFSEEGSRIFLTLERSKKDQKKVIIQVKDQGVGISKEALPHIFDLFYKDTNSSNPISKGNGIGLALTRQLIEIMGGTISVSSEVGKGTTFTVELPIVRNENQIYSRWAPDNKKSPYLKIKSPSLEEKEETNSITPNENDPRTTILLAEDNKDVALYIRSLFPKDQYNIIQASNGEKALEIINKQIPDIVISDIIMPKKNGIELCENIKSSPLLNHIPVILVTAKNSETDLIEGLKSGADYYLKKPFYPEELLTLVKNLMGTRQVLKEKYDRTVAKEIGKENEPNENKNTEFLCRVTDIIYREMKNSNFSSAELAQELAISISQLNKKLNSITGYPSSGYILQVKLNYAKKLLSTQDKTIGEVASECGIFDMNYFSRIFKKHTGVTPTQFKKISQIKTAEKSL